MNSHYKLEEEFKNMVFTLIILVTEYEPPDNQSDNHVLTYDQF